ncbi:MAG: non-canonical purine NTP diphosphatase [Dysgonamonadaceae bacterium]|jgi:XTP/dITP diphosphohydrolase|nr:non-canonical purine NTP diphosphatase [Dysgonamonadaceae bacterium]
MKKIVFATNNLHKLQEVREILGKSWDIVSLLDIGCLEDIPETANTLEGNALMKARYIKEHYGYDCFADDTGLEIAALDNAPGVYSARYAGESKDSKANMRKVLNKLEGKLDRSARFRTVIALLLKNREILFDGIINGTIIESPRGSTGFGYDPVFVPKGYSETFAEIGNSIKNTISHRALAVEKLKNYLNETNID